MNKEKIREDFKKVVDWVQENIADKCPDLIEHTNALIHKGRGTGYRVLRPGVLQLKVTDATHNCQWVDADRAIETASIKCIVNYLLKWKEDKRELEVALTCLESKADILENFKV